MGLGLLLPRKAEDKPNQLALERRYEEFLGGGLNARSAEGSNALLASRFVGRGSPAIRRRLTQGDDNPRSPLLPGYVRSDILHLLAMTIGKPLRWLAGEIKTPPFSAAGRIEAGVLLRKLQRGERLSMPRSRPMPEVGGGCHELRIKDERQSWRIVYRVDTDAILVLGVFPKKTRTTPKRVIRACQRRLREYDDG